MSDDDLFADEDALSSDSDSDNDPFTFRKHSFKKKKTILDTESSRKRTRPDKHRGSGFDEDALEKLNQHREESKSKFQRKLDYDSDDSDDVQIVGVEVNEAQAEKSSAQEVVLLLDSSDEEEEVIPVGVARCAATLPTRAVPLHEMKRSGISNEMCSTLQQAKMARQQLTAAQSYHAEDVDIPVAPEPSPVAAAQGPPLEQGIFNSMVATNLGPTLGLSLRSSELVNGKRSPPTSTDTLTIRRREPFQRLMDTYLKKKSLEAESSRIAFSFDGQKIDMAKTPETYDMEDDDLIDVLVESLARPAKAGKLGRPLSIKLRTSEGGKTAQDTMTIRTNEPLQKLMEKYRKSKSLRPSAKVVFQFDGTSMNLSKSPAFYDMEDDDMIDVKLRR